ncbi:T9SS type A sorting domain-containing protein [Hymenobacter sp. 15J16-1T3B]|uniref:T9SS type A sorting domain-containing protein n=1 Tax=Hymenobacter sp. 15J16-1T3B TaxID=2886941 RepID=UPI001D12D041|nr:T9SS type A sorting domain-containing protein [Hymenobacter sp. 15J16-1T3B]MCC3156316.1 T9SS type A sorting domain-containing protein [Hymenobacter sp. 15J16-1T3B]
MKHLYAYLALACLSFGARAQSIYRPLLRPGVLYQFSESGTAGDTTHTVRMNYASSPVSPDSLGRFSAKDERVRTRPAACPGAVRVIGPDGLFGATVTIGFSRHEYLLRAANGRTLLLKTQAPLNQSWTATTGLTASTTARGVATVLGTPDSVTTITFSDGQTLRLSKRFGFIEGPALGSYLNGRRPRRLTLTALNAGGRWTGQPAVSSFIMADYQPGDVFLRYYKQESYSGATCAESWTRDSVITRTLSPAGDSVTYTIRQSMLTRRYGSPSAPAGFCQNTPGTFVSAPIVITTGISVRNERQLSLLTGNLAGNPQAAIVRPLTLPAVRTANYLGRKVQTSVTLQLCPPTVGADSTVLSLIIDNGFSSSYAVGLGLVSSATSGIYYSETTNLIGYRKVNLPTGSGTETWGSLRTFANILKAADVRPASTTTAYPNPLARQLTVRFETQRPQEATVLLYDALGRPVLQHAQPVPAGSAQLELALPKLAAGLYTLHLSHDGRTELLKLTVAE